MIRSFEPLFDSIISCAIRVSARAISAPSSTLRKTAPFFASLDDLKEVLLIILPREGAVFRAR